MVGLICTAAQADTITVDTSAASLAAAVTAGGGAGLTVTGSSLSGFSTSSGTFVDTLTYGKKGDGIVISSGNVDDYEAGPNTSGSFTTSYGVLATAAQQATLFPITGKSSHYDVTELDITFDVSATTTDISFLVVWGSDEYAEFVGTTFIDGFGLFVNGVNIAISGGFPVNVNHPAMSAIGGTEMDGVLAPGGNPILTFTASVTPGSVGNTIKFIIADSGDSAYDSTAFISGLGGGTKPPAVNGVPLPAAAWLGLGLMGLLGGARRIRRRS
jgi:hypothetical protein